MKVLSIGIFLILISSSAQPSIEQNADHPPLSLPELRTIAFGDGRFVAAGDGGIYFSEDHGQVWNIGTNAPAMHYASVIYTNGLFIAVGSSANIVVSPDGRNWVSHPITSEAGLLTVIYANDLWVATGNNGLIVTSLDGQNWTESSPVTDRPLRLSTYINGNYWASDGVPEGVDPNFFEIVISTNGSDWSLFSSPLARVDRDCNQEDGIECAEFNRIVGVQVSGSVMNILLTYLDSASGMYMTRFRSSNSGRFWSGIVLAEGEASMSGRSLSFSALPNNLYYLNGLYFQISVPFQSTNLLSWTAMSLPYSQQELFENGPSFYSMAYGGGYYVMVGGSGGSARIARSSDAVNWERMDFAFPRIFGERTAGGMKITFTPTTPENFDILEATSLPADWQIVVSFTNISTRVEWIDSRAIQGNRFYIVRHNQ